MADGGLGDLDSAMAMRDIVYALVQQALDQERPAPTYGTVQSIDLTNRNAMVVMNGDTVAVKVVFGSIVPSAVGQIVRLEGPSGARYIADIMGSNATDALVPWSFPTLTSGYNVSGVLDVVKYRKITDHGATKIQMAGRLNVTSMTSSTMFTLPVGYRPVVNLAPVILGRGYGGGSHVIAIDVNADGTVNLVGANVGITGVSTTGSPTVTGSTQQPNVAASGDVPGGSANAVNGHTHVGPLHSHGIFSHTHPMTAHSHGSVQVTNPDFVSFNGAEWFI